MCDSDGLSSNYCGNERRKTAYIHTYIFIFQKLKRRLTALEAKTSISDSKKINLKKAMTVEMMSSEEEDEEEDGTFVYVCRPRPGRSDMFSSAMEMLDSKVRNFAIQERTKANVQTFYWVKKGESYHFSYLLFALYPLAVSIFTFK